MINLYQPALLPMVVLKWNGRAAKTAFLAKIKGLRLSVIWPIIKNPYISLCYKLMARCAVNSFINQKFLILSSYINPNSQKW
jgi:hypothetical protein